MKTYRLDDIRYILRSSGLLAAQHPSELPSYIKTDLDYTMYKNGADHAIQEIELRLNSPIDMEPSDAYKAVLNYVTRSTA